MTQSKTLEEVEVWEHSVNNEVVQILLEAMNHSSVKKLKITGTSKDALPECSYPTDRVEFYTTEIFSVITRSHQQIDLV